MGIGKVLGKVFNPEKLGDSLISGIDKAILTKEEKMDYMKEMLVLYQPYKLAQRILAIMFTGIFLLIHFMTAMAHFYLVVTNDENVSRVIELYDWNNKLLGYPVLTIIGFYFAGGVFEGIATKVKAKRDKKNLKEE
tara:strand:+ start:629 stop:1036 length:408 start_codon:yes stop_codon:yes gene_type:complete